MTTITLPRATVEQSLEALEAMQSYAAAERKGLRICDEAIPALRTALSQPNPAQQIVDEQAEDEALWFVAQTAPEAYLQQALRRLHAAVEGEK